MRRISIALLCALAPLAAQAGTLRICSDPNNLPFSNDRGQGFENRIAELLGHDLHVPVQYTWWAQRRGFVRNTLKAGRCDVVIGIASGDPLLSTTRPYYASSYVFVSRAARALPLRTLDDPLLRRLKIGVPLVGDDGANTPPAHALARRGIVVNVVGYPVYGDYREDSPPSRLVRAVADGDVDVAIAWGPLAGYYARRSPVPLTIGPLPAGDGPALPFTFGIAMGVRRGDEARRARLEDFLTRRRAAIDALLADYGVPRTDLPRATAAP